MSQFTFDASKVEPNKVPDAMPAGKYNGIITKVTLSKNKAGNGKYLLFEFAIIDAPFQKRKLKDFLNIVYPDNTQVEEIANSQLSAICHSTGVLLPVFADDGNCPELYNKPLCLALKINSDGYNDIKGYSASDPATLATVTGPAAPTAPIVPAGAPKFDPNTGQPIVQTAPTPAAPKFDPNTGLPIQPAAPEAPVQKFDPNTGLPLHPNAVTEIKNPNPIGQPAANVGTVTGPWD